MDLKTKIQMRNEAISRMHKLGLDDDIISYFADDNELCCSNYFEMTEVPAEIQKEIEEWQNKFHNLVYHVIHGNFVYETYECLSVSCHKEDWGYERDIMDKSWVMSHSINIDVPVYTESGPIKIANKTGILKRIG